jgi:hypothetical protein
MTATTGTTWKIGETIITRIEELLGPGMQPEQLLATWDPEVLEEHGHWLVPNFYQPSTNQFIMSVHSWLIRTPHHTILVDTCCGNAKNRVHSPFFHQLDTRTSTGCVAPVWSRKTSTTSFAPISTLITSAGIRGNRTDGGFLRSQTRSMYFPVRS